MAAATQTTTKQLFEVAKDGRLILNLHSGQSSVWDSSARQILMLAGSQGGKTSLGPWWLWREIQRCGPGDYLAVTATYDLFKLKMLPEMLKVFVLTLGIARYWAGDKVIELCKHEYDPSTGLWVPIPGEFNANRQNEPMWGRIILRSASAEGGLESATANAAWLDECGQDEFPVMAYEAVLRRLALAQGRLLMTTTPYSEGWLKQRVYDQWVRGNPEFYVVQFASVTNPAFPIEEFERRRATMPLWKFKMFYMGLFDRPAGLIYGDFVDAPREMGGHLVEPFIIPKHWPRWGAADPGPVHTAKLWAAEDVQNGVLFIYRESLEGDKSSEDHVQSIIQMGDAERVIMWFVGQRAEKQTRIDWSDRGLSNVFAPPVFNVENGIDTVIRYLKGYQIYFFNTLYRTLDEIGTYRRKVDDNDEVLDSIHNKEKYHLLDALRYLCVGYDHRPILRQQSISIRRAGAG